MGSVWAWASGPLVAGHFQAPNGQTAALDVDADGKPMFRAGFIWGGGRVTMARPYYLLLNPTDQNPRIAAAIAERLNSAFHTTSDPNSKVAEAKNNELILVNVPNAYRHNHYRFLLVARQVPYTPVPSGGLYRQKLEEELMDPSTALSAAIKLEALGGDCRRSLRVGLESPSPWVRFASAEALAYLGQTDGAGELARLAEDHPALRAHCLKALASMDDAACTDRLVDLLAHTDPELRYGAFIALRLADDRHPALNGQLMNRSYWLHRVAPDSPPAVHLTSSGRNEVVIFGDTVKFHAPVPPVPVGSDFTVSVPDETGAKVTRVVKVRGEAEVKEIRCSADLAAVLGAIERLGGGHTEAIDLIRRAARAQLLTAPLVIDSIPRELNIRQLAGFAKIDGTLVKANAEVARVGTIRPAVAANGFELPTTQEDQITPAGAPLVKPPLNRDPGRLFGPKRASDAPILDPAVVPAGGQ
jgi:HEAT repeat protein